MDTTDQSGWSAVGAIGKQLGPVAGLLAGLLLTRIGAVSNGLASFWRACVDRLNAHTEELRSQSRRRDQESTARAELAKADAAVAIEAVRLRRMELEQESDDAALRRSEALDNIPRRGSRTSRRTGGGTTA